MYVRAKAILADRAWVVVAGQPPRGTNHLPVVEVKDPLRESKGSGGAYKPDLIAWHSGWFLLVECKPGLDANDAAKLGAILGSRPRLAELWAELESRRILDAIAPPGGRLERSAVRFVGALAHADTTARPLEDLGMVICSPGGDRLVPGSGWSAELAGLFRSA